MTEFWELRRPKPKPKTTVWLVVACIATGLWALFASVGVLIHPDNRGLGGMANSVDPFADLGYLAGQVIVATLLPIVVVWVLLFFTVVRRVAPERGVRHLGVLVVVGLLAGLSPLVIGASRRVPDDPVQMGIADKEISEAMVEALNPDQTGTVDPAIKATGEAGEIERLTKQMIIALQTDHQHYLTEMQNLGYPNFLSGKWLAGDRGLQKSRARLAQAVNVVAKYRALNLQRIEEFKTGVGASSLSERQKAGLLAGLARGLEKGRTRGERIWALDAGVVAEFQSAIEDLARARGRWSPSGNNVVFTRQSDLDTFNRHLQNLRAMGAESDQIKRDTQADIKAKSAS